MRIEWTSARLTQVCDLYAQGMSLGEISEALGIERTKIHATVERARLGEFGEDIKTALKPRRVLHKWTPELLDELCELYSQKYEDEKIAEIMGMSKNQIIHTIFRARRGNYGQKYADALESRARKSKQRAILDICHADCFNCPFTDCRVNGNIAGDHSPEKWD